MVLPGNALQRAVILDFRPELGNRCSIIVVTVENGPSVMDVAATSFRVWFYSSLSQRRMARLLRPSPQLPSASDSVLRCREGKRFRLQQSYRQRVPASDSNIERRPDGKKDSRAIPRCPYFIRCHRSTRLKCFDCFLV